ncbi:Alkaline phosphatase [Rubellimicrobium mesophilum DSM 19309]|uniref:Alkaline phosphatase n=1 Tax=Rubellimicrobium mesophilum DSM 19309 TaxID=442562 RepID=A0A017HVP8_9RHOB|nr:family 16 glycosylhydrolase [Rubellimicrobium mesophilum]EYD78405.1 Alkaline phosphatase [Rubellimicrobium mesophilum DSM 19309]
MFNADNDLVYAGQGLGTGDWQVSTWDAGWLSSITNFTRDRVRIASDGAAEVVLGSASPGSYKATGGEMKSGETADVGTFSWTAQAPRMAPGTVFGMFANRAQNPTENILEFDWEFVGADTRHVQVTVHMENGAGKHIRNLDRTMVDLGFDAAAGVHEYEITLTGKAAIFRVDDRPVAQFDASDMPGGVWYAAPMRSYVNLWAGDSRINDWAGTYKALNSPIKARIIDADVRDGDVSGSAPRPADNGPNTLVGTNGNDVLNGYGGNDVLSGGLGSDRLNGGDGNDKLSLDAGNDIIDGGAGNDWITVASGSGVSVNLGVKSQQSTGLGSDVILNIENAEGSWGADTLRGSDGANYLEGAAGNDTLRGQGGADTLHGGLGRDVMSGGADWQRDVFVFDTAAQSLVGSTRRDIINDFVRGVDEIDLRNIDANTRMAGNQAFGWGGTHSKAYGVWTVDNGSSAILKGDINGDGQADFEIQINGIHALGSGDLLF